MRLCKKCSVALGLDHDEVIVVELDKLSNGKDTAPRIRARLRQLVHQLRGLCPSCAHHATQREWHKCKRCQTEVYAPATRCDQCGGELWGIKYPKAKGAA